jgi:hypothetical protein
MWAEPESDTNITTDKALQRLFLAAILLTGSTAGAEHAVQEGVGNTDGVDVASDSVFRATLLAATNWVAGRLPEKEAGLCPLPAELSHVVLLPSEFRHAFVLRLLLGLSVSQCSVLLSTDARLIERNTVSAVRALATISGRESGVSISDWETFKSDSC